MEELKETLLRIRALSTAGGGGGSDPGGGKGASALRDIPPIVDSLLARLPLSNAEEWEAQGIESQPAKVTMDFSNPHIAGQLKMNELLDKVGDVVTTIVADEDSEVLLGDLIRVAAVATSWAESVINSI